MLYFIVIYFGLLSNYAKFTPNIRWNKWLHSENVETNEELKYIRMELESQQHLQRKQRLLAGLYRLNLKLMPENKNREAMRLFSEK
ncbi:hypothetical protein CFY87_04175 [Actinobacillus seminis]|uniref:Uncharacterized protein n=1 Tax=Actinobacillus seminis TaxID=722 RepID=A0A263HF92_9PAST|nr:hypothetical protein [Actinobacillus seminis]OZN25337.1 hypothetical protein CFY87_04175 [Actinobacillus seminis]SUU35727.1 Uncharacterised protein [Actinobacillus seminis]